jgi:hypothetical protein
MVRGMSDEEEVGRGKEIKRTERKGIKRWRKTGFFRFKTNIT